MIWITGEALIDFLPEAGTFRPHCGGGSYNVAKAAARQGARVAFLGPLSTDLFGQMLAEELAAEAVDTSHAARPDDPTVLAFVTYRGRDARYAFYDRQTAMQLATYPATLPLEQGDFLHAGSISLIGGPGGDNTETFVLSCRDRAMITLDPNARPGMIRDLAAWRARIGRLSSAATVVRLSDEDLAVIAPGIPADAYARTLLAQGVALVVVTRGADGAQAMTPATAVTVPICPGPLVDTVGAGDAVMGTILAGLGGLGPAQIAGLGPDALGALMTRAMAAAALNCGRKGCDPPTAAELDTALAGLG